MWTTSNTTSTPTSFGWSFGGDKSDSKDSGRLYSDKPTAHHQSQFPDSCFGSLVPSNAQSNPMFTTIGSMFGDKNLLKTNLPPSGLGQLAVNDGGRRTPYSPTHTTEKDLKDYRVNSISCMDAYSGMSHEEVRLYDYQTNCKVKDSSAAPKFESNPCKLDNSNQQTRPSLFGPHCNGNPFASASSSASSIFTVPTSPFRPYSSMCGLSPPVVSFGVPQNEPRSSKHANPTIEASQGTNTGLRTHPSGLGVAYGPSCIPAFVNHTTPANGSLGTNGVDFAAHSFGPVSGAIVPAFVSYTPHATAVIWAPHFGLPGSSGAPCMPTFIGAFGGPSTGFVGLNGPNEVQSVTNRGQSTRSECVTNPADGEVPSPAILASVSDHRHKEKEDGDDKDDSVPEGLEFIVEKLGVNPWEKDNTAEDSRAKVILPCEEADKDEDIIAVSEFAVEQHNAIEKEGKYEFVRVVGACLEAVYGGRYHIVLDAQDAVDGQTKRFYAVVLQKGSRRRSCVTVLEKWLPYKA